MNAAWSQNVTQKVPKTATVLRSIEPPLDSVRLPATVDPRRNGPPPRSNSEREAPLSVEDFHEHKHTVSPCPSVFVRQAELGLVRARCD